MPDHLTPSERALREAAEKALDCYQLLEEDPRAVLALLDEIERLRGAASLAYKIAQALLTRAVIEAVYHAIFAAGERAGLEKAAVWLERESFTNGPATDAAAAIIDRFRTDAPENDAAPTIDVAEFALFDAAKHIATAIRSLKEGTP